MSKIVKVGVMPGRIQEVAVEEGVSIASVLELAELSADGYEVKVDGNKVTDLDGTAVTSSTNLILLAKQVKGNADGLVKIGVMPGQIKEFFFEAGTSVADAIAQAELDYAGYEVKVDGQKVDPTAATIDNSTNLILLAKQVKGN